MVESSSVWDKVSIMDLSKDTMSKYTGTASINNGNIILDPNSSATFSYAFDTVNNIMQTTDLRFILDVINTNTSVNSRYDESVQVEVYIQYYEKQLDESGNVTGYLFGDNDTIQLMPYFRHEVDISNNSYEIGIRNDLIVSIEINFINDSENQVTFVNTKVFNSMPVMKAIETYGGGSGGGGSQDPDTPTLIDKLMLYSTSGEYTINKPDSGLILEVAIPEDILQEYSTDAGFSQDLSLKWIFETVSGIPIISYASTTTSHFIDGVEYRALYGRQEIYFYTNGVLKVRVEVNAEPTIYAERTITIINNNVTDMLLEVGSDNGSLNGTEITNCRIKLLPETTKSDNPNHNGVRIVTSSVDGVGEAKLFRLADSAYLNTMDYKLTSGYVNFMIAGKMSGKVKITAEVINEVNTHLNILQPVGFKKEFIVDVVGIPVPEPFVPTYKIETPSGVEINEDMTNLQIFVTSNDEDLIFADTDSPFGIESVNGTGQAIVKRESGTYGKKITYTIYPLQVGKIRFWVKVKTYTTKTVYYLEQEIDIVSIKTLPEITTIETNTGLFEITSGGGQLEIYPRPNYDWHGGFSFRQVSIDGGAVTLTDLGDYCRIAGSKNGKLNLICKPVYGPEKSCEISVSGQSPENVILTTADNIFKVAVSGNITVYAEPGNSPLAANNRYTWSIDKLDSDAQATSTVTNTNIRLTGAGLGRLRLNCLRYEDSKFMASQVVKVVQSLDSEEIVLPYPDTKTYWVLFRSSADSNKLYLATFNMANPPADLKLTFDSTSRKLACNGTMSAVTHYVLNGVGWTSKGNWSNVANNISSSSCSEVHVANLDIYDINGNLLVNKLDTFEDVNFNEIIYR